jgi:hypothetical protein
MKIRLTLKLQKKVLQIRYKTVPKSFRKKNVPFYVTDSFQIHLTFSTAEYASWEI